MYLRLRQSRNCCVGWAKNETFIMNTDINILIAEDSPTQAAQLCGVLEMHGYRVTVARNGREALESLRQHPPMMVITDIIMPEMDGYELCRQINANPEWKHLPVMLLTVLAG